MPKAKKPQRAPRAPRPTLDEQRAELERWHTPEFRNQLADILGHLAALAEASDPDPTALVHIARPPSRSRH